MQPLQNGNFEEEWATLNLAPAAMRDKADLQETALIAGM